MNHRDCQQQRIKWRAKCGRLDGLAAKSVDLLMTQIGGDFPVIVDILGQRITVMPEDAAADSQA